jgi:hypothetical protein
LTNALGSPSASHEAETREAEAEDGQGGGFRDRIISNFDVIETEPIA